VLGGHGKAFCAGADLNWMRSHGRLHLGAEPGRRQRAGRDAVDLWTCPVPVVGRVQGDCYAGGVGLAAVLRRAGGRRGRALLPERSRLGLLPATIGPYVVRALGEQAARRYFLTAERFSAARAACAGLRARAGAARGAGRQVAEIVAALVANGPAAVKACKRLVQDVAGRRSTPRCATTPRAASPTSAPAPKAAKACASFLDKREPSWKDAELDTTQLVALAAALGWASGMRLYAVVFLTGAAGYLGWMPLPAGLQVLQHPVVLGAELDAVWWSSSPTRCPALDTCGTLVHTFIRIPAGAALAAGVFGGDRAMPGLVTWWRPAGRHAGGHRAHRQGTTRAAVNTSPEPFSNIGCRCWATVAVVPEHPMLWLAWEHAAWFWPVLDPVVVLCCWRWC
jgi:methylglutaconyl-CoA hydratase